MKRLIWQLLLGLVVAAVLLVPFQAMAADPFVPPRPGSASAYGQNVPLYDDPRFEPWAYTLDADTQDALGWVSIHFWMNWIMVGKAWLLKLSLRAVEYALTSDFFTPFAERAGKAMGAFGEQLWTASPAPMIIGALSLAGLWAMLLYLRGRATRVWAVLGGSVLVLVATTWVLTDGPAAAGSAVDISRQMSVQVYRSVESVSPGSVAGGGLLARSGDATWRAFIYKPWLTAEFGTAAGEQRWGQLDYTGFLSMTRTSRYGLCHNEYSTSLQNLYCPWWASEFQARRMVLAVTTGAATAVYAGTLLLLAGSMILAQLGVLLLLALAPLCLLVALWWPERSVHLLTGYFTRILGLLVGQTMLAATLAVLLYLSEVVATAFPQSGWMLQMLLLTALAVTAVRYRYAWLAPLSLLTGTNERPLEQRTRAWLRLPQRQRPQPAAESAPVAEPLPVFATVQSTVAQLPAAPLVRGVLPSTPEESMRQPVAPPPPQPPREQFHRQMERLREWFYVYEGKQEQKTDPGSWNRPAVSTPEVRERRQHAGRKETLGSVSNIPAQRPKA